MSLEGEIVTWAAGRPTWQQRALHQIATGAPEQNPAVIAAELTAGTDPRRTHSPRLTFPAAAPRGHACGCEPLYHLTDSKIRVHTFYCPLGLSLLHYVHRQAQAFWPSITIEELQKELQQIQQFVLLYPAQGAGPYRTATVLSTQSLIQKGLTETLGLQQLATTARE